MNKGFIAIPILVIALLGITVVGGGGYAVYKVNQIQQESDTRVSELEKKIEQIAPVELTVELAVATTTATSSVEAVAVEEKPAVVVPVVVKTPAVVAPTPAPLVVKAPVDVCNNVVGIQSVIPNEYKLLNGLCIKKEDKCLNVEGIQEVVPKNMLLNKEYGCVTETYLDQIEEAERALAKAEREAEKMEEECEEAEDELADAEKEYNKYQKILDNYSTGQAMTQEYREASIMAVAAVNKISILESGVASACNGIYYVPTTVNYSDLMPEAPIYTNCQYDGYGYISCTSY